MSNIVTGIYLECNHLVAAIDADKPCPVCAEIRVAREGNHQERLELLKMARKEGREEVLEMAEHFMGAMIGPKGHKKFRQIYKEQYEQG